MASQTVFMSHETYTPARGGSASAEVIALRNTFGEAANDIVVANTKGFTGHPMGVGVEDVIAVKILEYGIVPPVPNFKEVDPDLGVLNLSRGGRYPVQYALHLAAGFGSQISLTLTRRIPGGLDRVDDKLRYQYWLDSASGYDRAELEVVKRNLRVKSLDGPAHTPAPQPVALWPWPQRARRLARRRPAAAAYHPQPMPAVRELLGQQAAPERQRRQRPESGASADGGTTARAQTCRLQRRAPDRCACACAGGSGARACGRGSRLRRSGILSSGEPPAGRPRRRTRSSGHRRRQDRLPAGHAGPGPGPGGRPGHRHGQAGRDLPGRARGLRHPAARGPQPARLPDAGECVGFVRKMRPDLAAVV